jgi:hypothetical protein
MPSDLRDESERILAALEDPRPLSESLPAHGVGHILDSRAVMLSCLDLLDDARQTFAPRRHPELTVIEGGRDAS